MLSAFVRGFADLTEPRIRRLILLTIGVAILVFGVVWTIVGLLLTQTTLFTTGWLDTAVDVLGGVATLALTWFLFPAIFTAVVSLFLDHVAGVVEQRHYPARLPAREASLIETILGSVKFLVLVIALNVLALFFLLVPPLFPFVFLAVNGYLLGREYFEIVALRHVEPQAARDLWRQHRWTLLAAGLVIALLLSVPLLNLVIPVAATAAMVHLWGIIAPRT